MLSSLNACHGTHNAGCIDVTDEAAFPWRRWLLNVMEACEVLRGEPIRVFIARFQANDAHPKLVVCCQDDTYAVVSPERSRGAQPLTYSSGWASDTFLASAVTADESWMRVA